MNRSSPQWPSRKSGNQGSTSSLGDLALGLDDIGSAIQIAMFVAPVLVVISAFLAKPMNLVFNSFELMAIMLLALMVNQVVGDGESNWFEGLQLILAYGIKRPRSFCMLNTTQYTGEVIAAPLSA
jgi:Sodium/calcium exchanger protein